MAKRELSNAELGDFIKYLLISQGTGLEMNPKTWPKPTIDHVREFLKERGF